MTLLLLACSWPSGPSAFITPCTPLNAHDLMTLSLLAYSWPGGPSAFTTPCTLLDAQNLMTLVLLACSWPGGPLAFITPCTRSDAHDLMTLSLLAYSWPGGPSAFTTLCTLWYLVVVRRRRSPSRRNRWKSLAPLSPSPFVSRPVIIGNARLHMCVTCGAFLHQVSRLDVALSKTLCVSYSCSTPVLYLQL